MRSGTHKPQQPWSGSFKCTDTDTDTDTNKLSLSHNPHRWATSSAAAGELNQRLLARRQRQLRCILSRTRMQRL